MQLKNILLLVFVLAFISCERDEDPSEVTPPGIHVINEIPAESEVGDTLKFEFFVYSIANLAKIEFKIGDSVLVSRSSGFIGEKRDSIWHPFLINTQKLGALLDFSIRVEDKNGQTDLKTFTVQVDEMITANYIVLKTEKAYADADTYRDTGTVLVSILGDEPRLVEKPFKTAYRNNGLFRYEYHEVGNTYNHHILHRSQAGLVRKWWSLDGMVETVESMELAIAMINGVSSSSAGNIPGLLLTEELGPHNILRRMQNREIAGSEWIDDKDHYVITGQNSHGEAYIVWIEKEQYLIRRIFDFRTFDTFSTETLIDILGEIDVEMDADEFLFGLPEN